MMINNVTSQFPHSPPFKNLSHPQTQLAAGGPGRDPIAGGVELGDGRHGRDVIAAQLGQLVTSRGVDVDEAVHITDAEALHPVRGRKLPLRPKTGRRGKGETGEPRRLGLLIFGGGEGGWDESLIAFLRRKK